MIESKQIVQFNKDIVFVRQYLNILSIPAAIKELHARDLAYQNMNAKETKPTFRVVGGINRKKEKSAATYYRPTLVKLSLLVDKVKKGQVGYYRMNTAMVTAINEITESFFQKASWDPKYSNYKDLVEILNKLDLEYIVVKVLSKHVRFTKTELIEYAGMKNPNLTELSRTLAFFTRIGLLKKYRNDDELKATFEVHETLLNLLINYARTMTVAIEKTIPKE